MATYPNACFLGEHFVIHSQLTSLLLRAYVNRKMIQNRKVIRLSFNVSFEQAMYNCKEQNVQKWPVLNRQKKHVHCPWNG